MACQLIYNTRKIARKRKQQKKRKNQTRNIEKNEMLSMKLIIDTCNWFASDLKEIQINSPYLNCRFKCTYVNVHVCLLSFSLCPLTSIKYVYILTRIGYIKSNAASSQPVITLASLEVFSSDSVVCSVEHRFRRTVKRNQFPTIEENKRREKRKGKQNELLNWKQFELI